MKNDEFSTFDELVLEKKKTRKNGNIEELEKNAKKDEFSTFDELVLEKKNFFFIFFPYVSNVYWSRSFGVRIIT